MAALAIVGAGMMGSSLSVPFVANGHEVRLVRTPLERDVITAPLDMPFQSFGR